MRFRLLSACCTLGVLISLGFAQRAWPKDRDPITIFSPSGKAKLWVNPSDPQGEGPANCKLTINGKVVWHKDLPFTFHEAQVSDQGLVGGYAYTDGQMGLGNFVVAVIDPTGKITFQEKTARRQSRFLHTDPDPKAAGIMLDPSRDRMIVRVDGADVNVGTETWQVYQLSTRKRLSNLFPEGKSKESGLSLYQTRLLPGTPLIVANWYQFENGQMGQYFTLMDEQAKSVWRLDLPGDYESGAKVEERFQVRDDAMRKGTILGTPKARQFEVRFVKQAQRVTFEAVSERGKWTVKEIGRKPYREPVAPKPKPLQTPSVDLKVVRKLSLPNAVKAESEIREVWAFDFIGKDRVAFLRRAKQWEFCVAGLNGSLKRRIALPKEAQSEEGELFLAKIKDSQFLVVFTVAGKKDVAKAWRVDAEASRVVALPKFKSFWVQSVAAFPDGRFAVLSIERLPFSQADHLTLHQPDGSQIWDKSEQGYGGSDEEMLSPEAVATDAKGRLVVLDNIRHSLQFFKADGKFDGIIDLDKKWGKRASYPTEITCLPGGRFWLYDFGSSQPCLLLDSTGKILRETKPAYPSGKQFDIFGAIRVDEAGNPWVTNRASVLRLDANGKVAQTLGATEQRTGLAVVADLHVAPDGRVYALDRLTCAAYAFDATGKSLFTAKPKATEFDDDFMGPRFQVARSGDIFIIGTKKGGYLHYSPTGKRIGAVPWRDSREEKRTVPTAPFPVKPSWRWIGSNLVDEKERAMATMRRWPDQAWMSGPSAIAPDGRMMSFEGRGWLEPAREPLRLAFFKANGLPDSQTTVPSGMPEIGSSAFDGNLCYFVTEKGLIAVNRQGKALWTYRPKGWDDGWKVFPSLNGLALYDGDRTVHWVRLP